MFDANELPENIQQLIDSAELCPLGPGRPNPAARAELDRIRVESLADQPIRNRDLAACCVSGLWLLHNYLDESHQLSQDVHSAEGSFWHGIMHRREPDFPNAKYWFRRAGKHPVFDSLPAEVAKLRDRLPDAATRLSQLADAWDAMFFIDLCEEAYGSPDSDLNLACRHIADSEWKLLFQYCLTRAT